MEYCEKNNLRTVIDEGISKNEEKLWQYFGEIVQGLAYIHEQVILIVIVILGTDILLL